jgi:hypothetical protein
MATDPNSEWLGHVQPVGLVVAPNVLAEQGLVPSEQTRADTEEFRSMLAETGPAVGEPWELASVILNWPTSHVAGAPGASPLPSDSLRAWVPEAETELVPDWAVAKPGGGWQMLVQRLPPSIEPDRRGALHGWEATPHQRLERLLRETGVPTGLLLSDESWRLVHAPRGETSGQITFPLRPMGNVAGRPMLGGFKLLLDKPRLFTDAPAKRLPAILTASREAQAAVSAALAGQVLGALHELLRGLHAAEPERLVRLTAERPQQVYEGLLTVLLRLIFLLYAEDRDLIPSRIDAVGRALYHRSYGVRGLHARLRRDAARNPDTMNERFGGWGQLLATFRLVHAGDGSGWIRGRGGDLFDPARFPFLQGQDLPGGHVRIPRISDGAVLRVLDGLVMLNGERLSYRTLDVEQIGSVYETVMGFAVQAASGPALAIKAGKNNRTPVFVDLAALAAKKGKDRIKDLKEEYSRGQLSAAHARAVEGAKSSAEMAEALRPIVDERGSFGGGIVRQGTPILQPTDERRRTGSHYTPRTLTQPIVQHALEPAFERIGADATPEAVLALKVCDPAMGSGAFLVETCRQLATRLVAAWARHPGTRPPIPLDEDEDLLARRLVAQRCLYGVDRNPLAVDLARLSLWLATLARDHEFTFLDHALKSGDSLVGLTRNQVGALTWGDDRQDTIMSGFVRERVAEAVGARAEIRDAPDDVMREIQEARHRILEARINDVRALGDAVLACFFAHDKPRAREGTRQSFAALPGDSEAMWAEARQSAETLQQGSYPIRPFHWELEFPEVFQGATPGFDAIVGNPPFAGKNTLINSHREHYLDWLQTLHEGAHGNADLVAHFFRRAFGLLRPGGCLGLIATNTIGQGDTRQSGLRAVIADGGTITHAIRRLPWPGEAAVVVSVVHVLRGSWQAPVLDGRQVRRISAYLVEGDLDDSPAPLAANAGKAFVGMYLLGLGFTFDDEAAAKGKASPVSEMHRLIAKDPRNAERIFPYLGGEEVNSDPRHAHRRWTIDFNDFPLRREVMTKSWAGMTDQERGQCRTRGIVPTDYPDPVATDWPDLLAIVERLVKPERDPQKRDALRDRWWQFAEKRPGLRAAVAELDAMHVLSRVSAQHSVTTVPAATICAETTIIFANNQATLRGILQSRAHELWAAFFASSLEDRLRYGPSDCFEPFAFPDETAAAPLVAEIADEYHQHRAALMIARSEGLTKTYNRFHDPLEIGPDIQRLRDLHHEMDVAVLRAYGWVDLADTAAPEFLTEETEQDHRYQGRLFWAAPFRDKVLARLLALNAERAAEERAFGIAPLAFADWDIADLDA